VTKEITLSFLYETTDDTPTMIGEIIGTILSIAIYAAVVVMVAKPILGF
jgi:hypothetical protein